ncbi:hypothetical protein PL71_03175 [Pseudoalteromonas distincta]|uniref:Uncharacterized protein n=1 Tax=Pseudoalteromonas distincta TaxID=77608 RepID=A0ABT9GHD7_9GAMM|nr:hypothetical protein [Pseudoalteromonas distincta]KHM50588.1 hypothetical protein PL71_03175 [Pseudoalteromonas elyakovii]KID33541.1 hypothetical protein QT16_19710 [Pseudoalteromonas distincta]MDP4485290.1 hypothetical protein [Pseudoalteromonas elyakovii]
MQSARFIPFRKQDIVDMCSEELKSSTQKTSFKQFCDLLASLIHYDYHPTLESLKIIAHRLFLLMIHIH